MADANPSRWNPPTLSTNLITIERYTSVGKVRPSRKAHRTTPRVATNEPEPSGSRAPQSRVSAPRLYSESSSFCTAPSASVPSSSTFGPPSKASSRPASSPPASGPAASNCACDIRLFQPGVASRLADTLWRTCERCLTKKTCVIKWPSSLPALLSSASGSTAPLCSASLDMDSSGCSS